jgi:Kef-type K+ transport system membrane component KefB
LHGITDLLSIIDADPTSGGFVALLGVLVAVTLFTKFLGELAQRIRQPSVLGELAAGVVLGGSVLGVLNPSDAVIHALAELGVLILLFQIGLHTDLRSLLAVGATAGTVGGVGVVLPFAFGYLASMLLGLTSMQALVCAAALTATSIGISARVLADLGELNSEEGRVVIGAAVLDDVVGLIILSIVSGVAAGGTLSVGNTIVIAAVAVGFVVVSLVIGNYIAPPLFRRVASLKVSGALGAISLAFALAMAWIAARVGSAPIIGAFAAGLILNATPQSHKIEESTKALGYFFVPFFFAAVGAAVNVRSFADPSVLALGGVLIVVGVVTKFVAGYAPFWFKGRKALIGVAMVPRGEVGLIFAQLGIATAVLGESQFNAVALMVMVTTLVAPPLLSALANGKHVEVDTAMDRGLESLVAGTEWHDLTERPPALPPQPPVDPRTSPRYSGLD